MITASVNTIECHIIAFMDESLASLVRKRREELGFTSQAAFARHAGISSAHLNQIEGGKITVPNADLRRRLSSALGLRHIDLLVAAGEITAEEAGIPDDLRSEAERRLSPLIAEIGDDEIVFRAAEAGLRSGIDLGKKIRSGTS